MLILDAPMSTGGSMTALAFPKDITGKRINYNAIKTKSGKSAIRNLKCGQQKT